MTTDPRGEEMARRGNSPKESKASSPMLATQLSPTHGIGLQEELLKLEPQLGEQS